MSVALLALTTFVIAVSCSTDPATQPARNHPASIARRLEQTSFEADVLPILSEGCRPCHFEGGKMHEKLPFDRPETIRKLGERLFTRIRGEEERAVVRAFLADAGVP